METIFFEDFNPLNNLLKENKFLAEEDLASLYSQTLEIEIMQENEFFELCKEEIMLFEEQDWILNEAVSVDGQTITTPPGGATGGAMSQPDAGGNNQTGQTSPVTGGTAQPDKKATFSQKMKEWYSKAVQFIKNTVAKFVPCMGRLKGFTATIYAKFKGAISSKGACTVNSMVMDQGTIKNIQTQFNNLAQQCNEVSVICQKIQAGNTSAGDELNEENERLENIAKQVDALCGTISGNQQTVSVRVDELTKSIAAMENANSAFTKTTDGLANNLTKAADKASAEQDEKMKKTAMGNSMVVARQLPKIASVSVKLYNTFINAAVNGLRNVVTTPQTQQQQATTDNNQQAANPAPSTPANPAATAQ